MDWIKRIIREMWPFWLLGAASGTFIAITTVDTIRLKECNAQIVELRQELAQVQIELRVCQERVGIP